MALSQDQWFKKLKSWVPAWFFETPQYNEAVFFGIAKVIEKLEIVAEDHVRETYISQAVDGYLDEHGLERNLVKIKDELENTFRQRVKNLTNTTACPTLKEIVDTLLEVGESTIIEDHQAGVFFDREHFFDRGDILINPIYNAFSIVVDNQVHAPYSFFDREYFFDREDFIGLLVSKIELFEIIVENVNKSKALGTLYRLIERVA